MSAKTAQSAAYGLLSATVVAGGLAVGALLAPIAAAEPVAPIPGPAPAAVAPAPPAAPAVTAAAPAAPAAANAAAPAAATVTAAAPAATADSCQASKMTKTVGDVVTNAASYLEQHPDVDQAFTEIKNSPQDQIASKTQAYLTSRPDVAMQLGTIASPLNDMRTKCGLPIDIAQALNGGGVNPAAVGVNPALLTALSQNPATQAVTQSPAVQAVAQNPAAQTPPAPQTAQAPGPAGTGPAPGPATQPVAQVAGPVGAGPAPGPAAAAPAAPVGTGPAPGPATPQT